MDNLFEQMFQIKVDERMEELREELERPLWGEPPWDTNGMLKEKETPVETPESLRQQADALNARAAALEALPLDTFENGHVLLFTKKMSGRNYEFAAIKAGGAWYRTGRDQIRGFRSTLSWRELLEFVGLDNLESIEYVTDTEALVG